MKLSTYPFCLFLGSVLLLSGCGGTDTPPAGEVTGKVTLEGEALQEGVVSFYSAKLGSGGSAEITTEGTYTLSEPLQTGQYAVTVLPPPEPPPQDLVPQDVKVDDAKFPARYRDPQKSNLTLEIVEGDNIFDIDMKK
ncbi:hypothetical protein [Gimesia sp.]|uniref:hypothetical protein n=1 Tax=Gimesia sp. TaxID=2024833 RepID=UPI0032EC94F6